MSRRCRAAAEQAQTLYDAGEARFGTDEATFIELLCGASPAQNAAIARAYEDTFDHSLAKAVASEFSGNLKVSHRRSLSMITLGRKGRYSR